MKIIYEQQNPKPTNLENASNSGWSKTKETAINKGECNEDQLENVTVEDTALYKCPPSSTTGNQSGGNNSSLTFQDDKNLSQLQDKGITKLKNIWGVTPESIYKKLGLFFVYKTKEDKVYLASNQDNKHLKLIKDRKTGNEGMSQSKFSIQELINMSDADMQAMLNRVSSISENRKIMKNILKEEFQKRENDKNIISKRFNILSESKKTWTASNLISEVSYLKKQNYSSVLIKEGLVELMKSLYDDDPTFIPKIKDSYKGWLMKKLPNESELFKKSLETSIEDLENDSVPALFTDCNKVVEMMYEAMIKGMVDEKFDVVGVPKDIEDLLRSEIINNIKKDEFKSKVKQQLTNKICPQYGDLLRNTQKTFDDIKNKLVS
jgi:hypothetical protein